MCLHSYALTALPSKVSICSSRTSWKRFVVTASKIFMPAWLIASALANSVIYAKRFYRSLMLSLLDWNRMAFSFGWWKGQSERLIKVVLVLADCFICKQQTEIPSRNKIYAQSCRCTENEKCREACCRTWLRCALPFITNARFTDLPSFSDAFNLTYVCYNPPNIYAIKFQMYFQSKQTFYFCHWKPWIGLWCHYVNSFPLPQKPKHVL